MNDSLQFDFNVPITQLKNVRIKHTRKSIRNEPRLRQSLILAYQVEEIISEGKAKDFKQVAQWLNLSKARLSQIVSLLNLASSIQEEILLSNADKIKNITVPDIRPLLAEMNWERQMALWNAIQ